MRKVALMAAIGLAALVVRPSQADGVRKSPELAIGLNNGGQALLSQYRGKVVVVAFILTYCPHCQKTIGVLSRMQNEYGPRGFQVLASAIEDNAKMAVPDFLRRFNPPFPVGFNSRDTAVEYLQHPSFLRFPMPQIVFVDKLGTIRSQYAGDNPFFADDVQTQTQNFRSKIEELLKEAPAPQKKAPSSKSKK